MNADDLAVAVTAPTEFAAETKAAVLRSSGIEATVIRNAPSWTGHVSISPSAEGASVLVRREDLARARAVLEQTIEDSVDLDWDEVDVGEREDNVPLHPIDRMPPLARIAFALAAALLLLSGILGFILLLLP